MAATIHARRRCGIVVLFVPVACPGCAMPPRMRLTLQTPDRPGETAWWQSDDPAAARGPIVGIEHGYASGLTRQIVFSDRGIRIFEYHGKRLTRSSPPVSGPAGHPDASLLRSALRRYSRNPAAAPVMTLPPLPEIAMSAVASAADVGALLAAHWSGIRTTPPPEMTYEKLAAELEHLAHGVSELVKASEAF
jgi:hypothetical protein